MPPVGPLSVWEAAEVYLAVRDGDPFAAATWRLTAPLRSGTSSRCTNGWPDRCVCGVLRPTWPSELSYVRHLMTAAHLAGAAGVSQRALLTVVRLLGDGAVFRAAIAAAVAQKQGFRKE